MPSDHRAVAREDPRGIKEALERRTVHGNLRHLSTRPPNSVDFSSNDFLSLATNAELRRRYLTALETDKTCRLGSGGSRLLDGNSTSAEKLENDLAAFYNAPAGLLCNSGYDANTSIFSCLPQPGDIIIYDELIHASVHDGMRLSRATKCLPFKHNNLDSLQQVLEQLDGECREGGMGQRNVFVAIEAVYSMDGDVAPISEMLSLLKRRLSLGNGHLVVDEAHSVGIFGAQGRGLVAQLGLEEQVSVRLQTFGKALACSGAIILCSHPLRQYLINFARPLIYTTFMPFPLLVAIRVSHTYLQQGKAEPLVNHLQDLGNVLQRGISAISTFLPMQRRHLLRIPETRLVSAISYVMSTQASALAAYCLSHGLWVRAILPPTVPAGTGRVRICLHAGNTVQEVEHLLQTIHSWVRTAGEAKL